MKFKFIKHGFLFETYMVAKFVIRKDNKSYSITLNLADPEWNWKTILACTRYFKKNLQDLRLI